MCCFWRDCVRLLCDWAVYDNCSNVGMDLHQNNKIKCTWQNRKYLVWITAQDGVKVIVNLVCYCSYHIFILFLYVCSCCFCATWERCALACGVMESLVREKSATPSPGFAPGLPVQTAPSDWLSSSTRPPTSASGSLYPGFISVTWRTAVKERDLECWKKLACTSQSWVTKVRVYICMRPI